MISIPQLKANYGIYDFLFEEEQLAVRIDRLRSRGDSLTGEISIIQKEPGQDQVIHQAKLNILSTQSRNTLSKYLNSRVNSLDWDAVLETVCLYTIAKSRVGEPVLEVGTSSEQLKLQYRLYPLLLDKECNLIYGPGGTGKSYIACLISVLVQQGIEHDRLVPKQGNVLYLDYETSSEEINSRIFLVQKGLSLTPIPILYRTCHQSLANEIEIIQQLVIDKNTDLVIVDSVGAACGGEPESAEVVLRYFMALRSLKLATLSIDHVTKTDTKMPFGSVFKYNAARSIYEVKNSQVPGDTCLEIGLYHRKINTGRLQKPIGLKMSFFEDGVIFETMDIQSVPQLSSALPLRDQIREILKRGSLTVPEITNEIPVSHATIRMTLNRNKHLFVLADQSGKRWGLLSNVPLYQ